MSDHNYHRLLELVREAVNQADGDLVWVDPGEAPLAANDNEVEWCLPTFPEGWHASP